MAETDVILLRLEAPMQSWGGAGVDWKRGTRACPSTSALTGLLGNALGWSREQGAELNLLENSLRYAVREDVPGALLRDYQTADLDAIGSGWTTCGFEDHGASSGTRPMEKYYLADASYLLALTLEEQAELDLDTLEEALRHPARPLHLGRQCCPPSTRIFQGRGRFESLVHPLMGVKHASRLWCGKDDVPLQQSSVREEVWDNRDYVSQVFTGSRDIYLTILRPSGETQ